MKICYIVVSAFLIIFYPRQLTHLMCFGRHRDKNIVKSKAAYWVIYLFWTIIFLIGCLMMGSAMKVNSTMDKLVYYFILGSDNRDCVELGSEENDEAYISTYYTRKEINESFLFEVVQKHEYAYEMCQLQELIIKKQDERWILYLNDEVMGYVEVKKGFLIRGVQLRKHSKAREKRYSFGYAVSFIFACYQILWTFPKSRYLCSRYLPLVCG